MPQHPTVTVAWTIKGLEAAIEHLGDGPAERRVRRQFHQLIVALERAFDLQLAVPPNDSDTDTEAEPVV